jgi:hypothetical protein
LVEHVFFCGSLAREFGAIVRLEDDYFVSPVYYLYATQALSAYAADPRIAGISLYGLWFNGYSHLPFIPYPDVGDTYFLQTPWSQGQAYTADQWEAYTRWRESAGTHIPPESPIHEVYAHFPPDDWFPLKTRYLAETNRFYAYPRESVCTNFGDAGTHFDRSTAFFQVPLQTRKRDFCFQPLDDTLAVYDSFLEMLPDRLTRLNPALAAFEIAVDLYGDKSEPKINSPYVLTTRLCRAPLMSFGSGMQPLEANIAMNIPGTDISLCRREDIRRDWLSEKRSQQRVYDMTMRGYAVSRRARLLFWLLRRLPDWNPG